MEFIKDSSIGPGSPEDVSSLSSTSYPSTPINENAVTTVVEEVALPRSPPVVGDRDVQQEAVLHARAYQTEMLQESLKQNVIVAMDTGSGKTQVAVLRMQAELERSSPDKIIWFLAPTVALCYQQFNVIRSQIPRVVTKMLSGKDGPETWSSAQTWDKFLNNVSIVVSTPQVLSDALQHDFVRIDRLSLIVFDEAHNCTGKYSGVKVMNVYWKIKQAGLPVPSILGLTASPVMNISRHGLEIIERTLDAVCKTPMKHREELLAQVSRPELICVSYKLIEEAEATISTAAMNSVRHVLIGLDIREDPFILRMLHENTERSRNELLIAVQGNDTPSIRQLTSLYRKSVEIRKELGAWAADFFVFTAVSQYLEHAAKGEISHTAWHLAEKDYVVGALNKVQLPQLCTPDDLLISDKVKRLITRLSNCPENTLGIIFVKETATVSALHNLLSKHAATRDRFRIGTMVGISRSVARKREVGEIDREDSLLNLESFRSGHLDLLIATSVLEEGIDVPACNLVICFDRPSNLKSFIQRRGRARMKNSTLLLFCEEGGDAQTTWEDLEREMKKQYEAEDREKLGLAVLEESDDAYEYTFSTRSGNEMDIDSAKAHLDHFCATLFSKQFVDCMPYYLFETIYTTGTKLEPPLFRATVVLPNSLPTELRRMQSASTWYSQKKACKDAAFQAYKKLYEAGLVNENLLPFKAEELATGPDIRLPEVEVSEVWNPWPSVARAWSHGPRYRHTVRLSDHCRTICEFELYAPTRLPSIPPFNVFWSSETWMVEIGPASPNTDIVDKLGEETMGLISLALGYRSPVKEGGQHVLMFHSKLDSSKEDRHLSFAQLENWSAAEPLPYLIRNTANGAPYFFEKWLTSRPPAEIVRKKMPKYYERIIEEQGGVDGPWLALRRWPRRQDFLHKIRQEPAQPTSSKAYQTVWPVSCCRIETAPIPHVQFGALIPSITHMIEIYSVAQDFSERILKDLGFQDLSLVLTAISASSAREATDYQKLEFLGDVLLKLLSTISVAVNHPQYPEGYLSVMRTRMISNTRLCRATKDSGIDKFILTKEFTGHKWKPFYVDEMAVTEDVSGTRRMSTKVLADIVESLTGAAFLDGGQGPRGMEKSLACLRMLMPDIKWHSMDEGRNVLASLKEVKSELPSNFQLCEKLLGYSFTNKTLLIEALTHGSYNLGSSDDRSYERLEFIGDAILDYIVVLKLWERDLPQSLMSPLRAACVNADLIGFLGMEWSIPQETSEVVDRKPVSSTMEIPFWKFMRHASSEVGALQKDAEKRRGLERGPIMDAIENSSTYPWALLAHLHIPKFFSDIFESIMGAVWLDSGDLRDCAAIVERIGILPYLERILDQGIDVFHPKNKLGEIAEQKKVEYRVEIQQGGGTQLSCKVYVGDEMVVEVGEGLNKDEIITKAAEKAYMILKARKDGNVGINVDSMDIDQ
ncbi:hypothetical protein PFICI_11249 [Pestalotiopsis fici W106-1]|uniref:Dicer-like protein 2 n=1 Tax=Pestalotiopsis fici (strain W106-1 / CGMCC3.15140) TaxID=1229662 RepID=W3WU45_PESFW|nr:uncharacterized protein PFICI_11249 [Pestalotiopsis fici W106-1]ETS77375.1 hypothetical protein PFICI_11249 [Pestalotiopsis fici W106-1]